MKSEKGLQKFTDSEEIRAYLEKSEQIEIDPNVLSEDEKKYLAGIMQDIIKDLGIGDRDRFVQKIEPLLSQTTRNDIWERNHTRILIAIDTLIDRLGRMPSKPEIAAECQLTRQTIHKHLREFATNSNYQDQYDQFKYLAPVVLAQIYQLARSGDLKAAKLYFNIIGNTQLAHRGNESITHQNNFININGIVINQHEITKLKPEDIDTIQKIFSATISTKD